MINRLLTVSLVVDSYKHWTEISRKRTSRPKIITANLLIEHLALCCHLTNSNFPYLEVHCGQFSIL